MQSGKKAITQSDVDDFRSGLAGLKSASGWILGHDWKTLGSIAKGLLLSQRCPIQSKKQVEVLQLMDQALGSISTMLIFWMGGSDDQLLDPLLFGIKHRGAVGITGTSTPVRSVATTSRVPRATTTTTKENAP
jgi:hypothetical protein